jgi:magnesium transporter
MLHAVPAEDRPRVSPEEGVVAATVYAGGSRLADIAVDEAGAWAKRPGHVVWIGLLEPSQELLARVQVQFGLHDLAIEDAAQPHQRPKLEQYGNGVFIVARTAHMLDGRISFGETHIFVGHGYIVSVRHGTSTSYAQVRQRAESCPAVLAHGEDYILYALLDFIVDNYLPVLEMVNTEVEAIEDRVFAGELDQTEVQRLYMIRRDLLRLRNAASALVHVCSRIQRRGPPDRTVDAAAIPRRDRPYPPRPGRD